MRTPRNLLGTNELIATLQKQDKLCNIKQGHEEANSKIEDEPRE